MNKNTEYPTLLTEKSVIVLKGGKRLIAHANHPLFAKIITRIRNKSYSGIERLFELQNTVEKCFNVTIKNNNEVWYKGKQLHNVLTDKILTFIRDGLPYKPLIKFFNKIMENPNLNSREQFYNFIVKNDICICEDGDVILYKAIKNDYTDKYTGTVSNTVGKIISMDRKKVDTNPHAYCSTGYHVAEFSYANGFGGGDDRYITCKVNPRDVCSVPSDNNQKVRVCRYKVYSEVKKEAVVKLPNYTVLAKLPKRDNRGRFCKN
jgi:hypothetical protein